MADLINYLQRIEASIARLESIKPAHSASEPTSDPFDLLGQHPADRVMQSQKLSAGSPHLHGEEPPTPAQVGAVLHALSDHTHTMWMLSDSVRALGADRDDLGEKFAHATGLGRYFQNLGDELEWRDHA